MQQAMPASDGQMEGQVVVLAADQAVDERRWVELAQAADTSAFEKLYRDPELRRRMGEAARERIDTEFRNEMTVQKTIALYEELVPDPD